MPETKLHHIIAVEKGARSDADKTLTAAYHVIQKDEPFNGLTVSYEPRDADGEPLPTKTNYPQVTVADLIKGVRPKLERVYDLVAGKEATNQNATADVVLRDGTVLLENVPATLLLFLEKQAIDLHSFVTKLPTLDPAQHWQEDPALGTGVWVSDEEQRNRSEKQLQNHTLAVATDKHPAQVTTFTKDVVIGQYTQKNFSGKLPAKEKEKLVARAEELVEAFKQAKESANDVPAVEYKIGADVLGFLFG